MKTLKTILFYVVIIFACGLIANLLSGVIDTVIRPVASLIRTIMTYMFIAAIPVGLVVVIYIYFTKDNSK
jgi:uncharacterized membrane protein (DUF106 family)